MPRKGYRTGDYRMYSTYSVCPKEGWFGMLLRPLENVQRRNYLKLVAPSRMDESIDSLGYLTVFLTLDAISECWRIEIDECDQEKPVSTSQHSLYGFIRTPFC